MSKNLLENRLVEALTRKNSDLTEERDVLSEENGELTRAADAVHFILNAGSFVCTYDLQGNSMLGVKYSEACASCTGIPVKANSRTGTPGWTVPCRRTAAMWKTAVLPP